MSKLALLGGRPVRKDFLQCFSPLIEEEEINEVIDILKSNWITTGPKTHEFETSFGEYIGSEHAIALHSCAARVCIYLWLRVG